MEGQKKRERSSNFTKSEVRLLVELVEKYRSIIENKKTDAVTNREKDIAWQNIANLFNGSSGCNIRNSKTLKLKYEGVKKETKKKLSKQRQEMYKTGGGPSTAPTLDDVEEKVVGICSNLTGLESRNDSDNVPGFPESNQETLEFDVSMAVDYPIVVEDLRPNIKQDVILLSCVENTGKIDENENQLQQTTLEDNQENDDTQKENKWASWTPKALKSKMSNALKPDFEKFNKTNVTKKIDDLTSARMELVQLQKEIARKEYEFVEEEHKLKMLHLANEEKRKQEIHELLLKKMHFQS